LSISQNHAAEHRQHRKEAFIKGKAKKQLLLLLRVRSSTLESGLTSPKFIFLKILNRKEIKKKGKGKIILSLLSLYTAFCYGKAGSGGRPAGRQMQ
jgi:hypothetical protein